MMEKTFLTLDSGGSKTCASLYTLDGELIQKEQTVGYGFSVDGQEELPELVSFLRGFCNGYKVVKIACNLGGKNVRQIKNALQLVAANAQIYVFRESEGIAGETLCEKYGAQVTLLVGTGSIAVAKHGNQTAIVGGWGANVSDDGSGYQLGLEAVRLALKEIDGTRPLSLLTKRLTGYSEPIALQTAKEYCEMRDVVREKLFPFDRAHIATFAKTVFDCAKEGDRAALALYGKTGEKLAELAATAAEKIGVALDVVVVTGGIVHSKEFWERKFKQSLSQKTSLKKIRFLTDGMNDALLSIVKR